VILIIPTIFPSKNMFFFPSHINATGEGDRWSRGLRWHLGTAEFQPTLCRGARHGVERIFFGFFQIVQLVKSW
jgi:hypothetical protein